MNDQKKEEKIKAFLNATETIFPDEWGWKKYEPTFREWAYEQAVLFKKNLEKKEDDKTDYTLLIKVFIDQAILDGRLPTQEEMKKKAEKLLFYQEKLDREAIELFC